MSLDAESTPTMEESRGGGDFLGPMLGSLDCPEASRRETGVSGKSLKDMIEVDTNGANINVAAAFPPGSVQESPVWLSSLLNIVRAGHERIVPCEGIGIALPEPAEINYPVGLSHALSQQGKNGFQFFFDGSSGSIRALDCPRIVVVDSSDQENGVRCSLCRSFETDPKISDIVCRAQGVDLHKTRINNFYLTDRQKDEKLVFLRNELHNKSLDAFNHDQRLATLCKKRDDLTRLKVALTENNIARANVILGRAARERRSAAAIVRMISDAAEGLYNPRQYTEDDIWTRWTPVSYTSAR